MIQRIQQDPKEQPERKKTVIIDRKRIEVSERIYNKMVANGIPVAPRSAPAKEPIVRVLIIDNVSGFALGQKAKVRQSIAVKLVTNEDAIYI